MRHCVRTGPFVWITLAWLTNFNSFAVAAPAKFTVELQPQVLRYETQQRLILNLPAGVSDTVSNQAIINWNIFSGAKFLADFGSLLTTGQKVEIQFSYETTSLPTPTGGTSVSIDPVRIGPLNGVGGTVSSASATVNFSPDVDNGFGLEQGHFYLYGHELDIPGFDSEESFVIDLAHDVFFREELFEIAGVERLPNIASMPIRCTKRGIVEFELSMNLYGIPIPGTHFFTDGSLPEKLLLDEIKYAFTYLLLSFEPELVVDPEDYTNYEDYLAISSWVASYVDRVSVRSDWQFHPISSIRGGIVPEPSSAALLIGTVAMGFPRRSVQHDVG